jgi:hypothetical protein
VHKNIYNSISECAKYVNIDEGTLGYEALKELALNAYNEGLDKMIYNNEFTEEELESAKDYDVLGPEYFRARNIAETVMKKFKNEHFKPIIDDFTKEFTDKLWTSVQDSLVSDTEMNIQNEIWRTVEAIVRAILGGNQYILQKYVLGSKYNCGKIRETIAKLTPEELQSKRITELEEELLELKQEYDRYRQRY